MASPDSGPLTKEDRHHGGVMLLLLSLWHDWVKRRVEQVCFVSNTTIVRRISIDFRLRSWLPEPVLHWNDQGVHYFPLALLNKRPLIAFDVRDEDGTALPLLTRRKNAALAAGSLSALAQFSVARHVQQIRALGPTTSEAPLPTGVAPADIAIGEDLEREFFDLAIRDYVAPGAGYPSSVEVLERFFDPPALRAPASAWNWMQRADGKWEPVGVDASVWRWQLMSDQNFRELATDFARLFMVAVPIVDERLRRRIVKLQFQDTLADPQVRIVRRAKRLGTEVQAERWMTRIEDWLEGLPRSERQGRPDEWAEPATPHGTEVRDLSVLQKIGRSFGWGASWFSFDVPAVGEGGSFHFEIEAPEGLQIRRATLTATLDGQPVRTVAHRGVRNVNRMHLYLGNVATGAWGAATVAVKPRSSTLIRGATLVSGLIAGGLTVAWLFFLHKLQSSKDIGPAAAILLIAPGIVAANVATNTDEHPMTNSLLFGLRLVTLLSGASAVAAAALLVADRNSHVFRGGWMVITLVAVFAFCTLAGAWRLAGRRRPSGATP